VDELASDVGVDVDGKDAIDDAFELDPFALVLS
jgi:hypothetical protein